MALTITDAGNGTSTSSSASVATGATVTAVAGDWLLAIVSADNNGTSGASSISSVTDSAGNTWNLRATINFSPGGVAADGATLGVYLCEGVTNALSSGTVTANFSPNTTAKAIEVYRVQPGSGEAVQFVACDATGNTGNTATHDAPTVSVNNGDTIFGLASIEQVGMPTGDSDTTDGSWSTLIGRVANVGGVAATSMVNASQYKTVTGTGNQSWACTTAAARDSARTYLILGPVAASASQGWQEPAGRPPPATKAPASATAWAPQAIAPPVTLTTSIGWFEPYAKRPREVKGPPSSSVWDPQAIAAPPTLTTSIGWFEPYARLPAKPAPILRAWVSVFGFRPDLGLGWFEPYAARATTKPRAPSDAFVRGQPTTIPVMGWFEPFAPVPRARKTPLFPSQGLVAPSAAAASTTGLGWYFSFSVPPHKLASAPATWFTEIGPVETPTPPVVDNGVGRGRPSSTSASGRVSDSSAHGGITAAAPYGRASASSASGRPSSSKPSGRPRIT